MSNTDFEKAMILFQIVQIDDAFKRAKQVVETQKVIGGGYDTSISDALQRHVC